MGLVTDNARDILNNGDIDIASNLKYKRGTKNCVDCDKEITRANRGRCPTCYARLYRAHIVSDESLKKAYEWRKKYRELNKDKIAKQRKEHRQEIRAYHRKMYREGNVHYKKYRPRSEAYKAKVAATYKAVCDYKLEKGCIDCGYNKHPEALDFDHLPQYEKKHGISALARSNTAPETLWAEIAKCEVRCTNCHRIKTYERRLQEKTATISL